MKEIPLAAAVLCVALQNALGTVVYQEDFEAGDGGFQLSGTASWEHGAPLTGPGSAHSGVNAWATGLATNYQANETGVLLSPLIDLSAYTNQAFILRWQQAILTEAGRDQASVEVTRDGGTSWQRVFGPASGAVAATWQSRQVFLNASYAVADFRIRFRLSTDASIHAAGFFVDDVEVQLVITEVCAQESFEVDDGGFTVTGANASWSRGMPSNGPGTAQDGNYVMATAPGGNYAANEAGRLVSPAYDLTAAAADFVVVSWWQFFQSEPGFDVGLVEVSKDDGATWDPASGVPAFSGPVHPAWTLQTAMLGPEYAVADFRIRFSFFSDGFFHLPGWYLDELKISAARLAGLTYNLWVTTSFVPPPIDSADLLPLADPDADDILNIMEFYYGTLPMAADPTPLTIERDGTNVVVRFPRAGQVSVVAERVETSTTLQGWSDTGVVIEQEGAVGDTLLMKAVISGADADAARLSIDFP